MKNIYKSIVIATIILSSLLFVAIGFMAIRFTYMHFWGSETDQTKLSTEHLLYSILGSLGMLLTYIPLERLLTFLKSERKLDSIKSDISNIANNYLSYQIIHDERVIADYASSGIKSARRQILTTHFINKDDKELPKSYYREIGLKILSDSSHFEYVCCFAKGTSLLARQEAFKNLNLTSKHYEQMKYFECSSPADFDFMLIDDRTAYIALPEFHGDRVVKLMIIVEANEKNEYSLRFIKALVNWYEKKLVTSLRCKQINTQDLIEKNEINYLKQTKSSSKK